MTSFGAWLRKQQGREDWVGDLAGDVMADREFPKGRVTEARAREHLMDCNACPEALEALEQAFREYRAQAEADKAPCPATA